MINFMLDGMRPSIGDLCNAYSFKPKILAILADVPEKTIQDMLLYRPVHKEEAKKVLEEISILLCRECTFETVYVPLVKERGPAS